MATQAQITANRLNAPKSTGPRTATGKALASKNSLKHGLSACRDVISTESQEEYDLHHEALLNEFDPQTPMESMLAARIVSLSWRLKRADLIQNQTIDVFAQKDATSPLAKLAKSFGLSGLPFPQPDPADSNPDLILGRIALKDFSNERVLDRLLMYERRIEHSLFKTTLELQRLRLLRNLNPSDQISNSNQLESPASYVAASPVPAGHTDQNNNPETAYLAAGPVPAGCTEPNNAPEPAQTITQHPESRIQHHARIMQNEPNFQNPKTAATSCAPKSYNNIPLHPTKRNEPNLSRRSLVRSRIKPNSRGVAPGEAGFTTAKPLPKPDSPPPICYTRYNMPHTEQQARSVSLPLRGAGVTSILTSDFPLADTAKTSTIVPVIPAKAGIQIYENQC